MGPDVSDGECLKIRDDPCDEFLLKLLVEAKDRVRCPHICKVSTASLFLLNPSLVHPVKKSVELPSKLTVALLLFESSATCQLE